MTKLYKLLLKYLCITIFFVQSASLANAQTIPVTIKFINTKKEPISFATITVTNRLDSAQVFKKVADSSGIAKFNLTKGSQYNIHITSVNYPPFDKGIQITGNQTFFSFSSERAMKVLDEAVVTSKKTIDQTGR